MSARPDTRRRPGADERSQEEVGFTRGNPLAAALIGLVIGAVLGLGFYLAIKPADKKAAGDAGQAAGDAGTAAGGASAVKAKAQQVRANNFFTIDASGTESPLTLPNRFGPEWRPGTKVAMEFTGIAPPAPGAVVRLRLFALNSSEDVSTVSCTVKDAAGATLGSAKPKKAGAWFEVPLSNFNPKDGKIRMVLSSDSRLLLCAPPDNAFVGRTSGETYTPYIEVAYP
ncbi:MAG: hypothetical protein RL095_1053 [Verrucomicrobiota bacterium]|jgi:hypothetical protein